MKKCKFIKQNNLSLFSGFNKIYTNIIYFFKFDTNLQLYHIYEYKTDEKYIGTIGTKLFIQLFLDVNQDRLNKLKKLNIL